MQDEYKKLYVRRQYGGQLTEAESLRLDAWIAAEGRDYAAAADEFSTILKEIAMIQVKPMDSRAMVARFEDMVRDNIRNAKRSLRYAVPAVLLFLLMGLFSLIASARSGRHDLLPLGVFLTGMAGLFSLIFWGIYRKHQQLLNDPDLIGALRRDQTLARTWRVRLNGWILLGVTIPGMAGILYWVGGVNMTRNYLISLSFMIAWIYWLQWRHKRKHRDLWEWFESESA